MIIFIYDSYLEEAYKIFLASMANIKQENEIINHLLDVHKQTVIDRSKVVNDNQPYFIIDSIKAIFCRIFNFDYVIPQNHHGKTNGVYFSFCLECYLEYILKNSVSNNPAFLLARQNLVIFLPLVLYILYNLYKEFKPESKTSKMYLFVITSNFISHNLDKIWEFIRPKSKWEVIKLINKYTILLPDSHISATGAFIYGNNFFCLNIVIFFFVALLLTNITEYNTKSKPVVNNKNRALSTTVKSLALIKYNKRYYHTSPVPGFNCSQQVSNFLLEKNLNPVFIYEDLLLESTRYKLLNETRGASGIYLILNKTTLDFYVGSASSGRFNSRFMNHLIYLRGSKIVKNAVKKYGISSFALMILEILPEITTKENNKKLLDIEDFYIKSLLPDYNILTEAGSSFGYKHTEITRIKMKANYSQERRSRIASLNKGMKLPIETIEAMKKAGSSRQKPVYSMEAIKNMKKASKPLLVYNLDHTVFAEFTSITEASKYLDCDQKTIKRALQTPKKVLRRRWILKLV